MTYIPRDQRDPPPTPRALSDQLESAKVFDEAALQALDDAERRYEAGLLTASTDELAELSAAREASRIDVDRSRARLAEADRLLKAATDPGLIAAQKKRRADAVKKTTAAEKLMLSVYPTAAEQLRDVLRAFAEAQLATDASNADASDEPRLPDPESFRSTPRAYKKTVEETEVSLWRGDRGVNQPPLSPEDQARVVPNPGPGTPEHSRNIRAYGQKTADDLARSGTLRTGSGGSIEVVQQRYRQRTVLPSQEGYQAKLLAESLVLPALYAGSSDPWPMLPGRASPDRVLEELAKPAKPRPAAPERIPEFEFEPIHDRPEPTQAGVVYGASFS